MSTKRELHVTYWVFKYLHDNYPDILNELLSNVPDTKWGKNALQTIRAGVRETYDRFNLNMGN